MKVFAFLLSLVTLSFSLSALAYDANSCDDFISRHQRMNLVATSMVFKNKNLSDPYQEVILKLKNVGERDFSGTGMRWMNLNIKGNTRKIQVPMPIASGQTIQVSLAVDPGLLKACEIAPVTIDLDHTVGQWGCMVWNDDKKDLLASEAGSLCRFPLPRPIIRDI